MNYSDELKELLQSNQFINNIWIDTENDEWHTHEVAGLKEVSRNEILKPKKENGTK